jgi:hypothetical protein
VTRVIAPPVVEAQASNDQPADGVGSNPPKPPSRLSLWWAQLLLVGEYGGFELLGIGALLLAIILLKRSRRSRRRRQGTPLMQVTAAWTELVERLRDLGIATRTGGTRRQGAETAGFPQIAWVASSVDEAVFAPGEPGPEVAAAVWEDVDAVLARLRPTRSRLRRFRAVVDPRSLGASARGWLADRIARWVNGAGRKRRPVTRSAAATG